MNSATAYQKKYGSPYLASLSRVQVRERSKSATTLPSSIKPIRTNLGSVIPKDKVLDAAKYTQKKQLSTKPVYQDIYRDLLAKAGLNPDGTLSSGNGGSKWALTPILPRPNSSSRIRSWGQSDTQKNGPEAELKPRKARPATSQSSTKSKPTKVLVKKTDPETKPDINKNTERVPEPILKSILKPPSTRSKLTKSAHPLRKGLHPHPFANFHEMYTPVQANENVTRENKPQKKVRFLEKVRIHPVPYETRGSTEWQHNLQLTRQTVLQSLMMDHVFNYPPDNFLRGGGSILNNWGYSAGTPRRY